LSLYAASARLPIQHKHRAGESGAGLFRYAIEQSTAVTVLAPALWKKSTMSSEQAAALPARAEHQAVK